MTKRRKKEKREERSEMSEDSGVDVREVIRAVNLGRDCKGYWR